MKELTIEEKAKAYDEAIGALRSLIAEQAIKHCNMVNIDTIVRIIPELKESEDERIRKELIRDIDIAMPIETAQRYIAWIEKQGEQNLAWSEEDEAIVSRVISIVKWAAYSDHSHPILNDEGATELVERLKSLRPQNTWKPSDKQMKALNAINLNGGLAYPGQGQELINLYNELKKLK